MEKVKKILEEEGRKMTWLSKMVGVSRVSVSYWLNGRHLPSRKNLRRIADVMGLEVSDLFTE